MRLISHRQREKGTTLPELMIAVFILTVFGFFVVKIVGSIYTHFQAYINKLDAQIDSFILGKTIREDHRRLQGETSLEIGPRLNEIRFGPVASGTRYRNSCAPTPQWMSKISVTWPVPDTVDFADCPLACPAGQRPVINKSVGSAPGIQPFPKPADTQYYGAFLCAAPVGPLTDTFTAHIYWGWIVTIGSEQKIAWEVQAIYLSNQVGM